MQVRTQHSVWEEGKWTSLAASHTAREAKYSVTLSHLPLWEKSQTKNISLITKLCCFEVWVIWLKSNYSSSLNPVSVFFFFFSLAMCFNISIDSWASTKALSSVGKCLSQCSLETPSKWPTRLELVHEPFCGPQLGLNSLCLSPNTQ